MPWKLTADITREELVAQLEQLRDAVERLTALIPCDLSAENADAFDEGNADPLDELAALDQKDGQL